MANNSFWFKHDYNARNDEKILELRANFGVEGYGVYWMIIESMCETDSGGIKKTLIGGLSFGYGVAKERLNEIIKFCLSEDVKLFYEESGYILSKRVLQHKDMRKSLSNYGKDGAAIRKLKGGYSNHYAEEKREEEKREEETNTEASKFIIPKMCELWYSNFTHYTKDKISDFEAMQKILQFMMAQSGEKDFTNLEIQSQLLNSLQLISNEVLKDKFWLNKPLKSIANNIQEFYNKIKNPLNGQQNTSISGKRNKADEGIRAAMSDLEKLKQSV